jgi:radical SAM protein with 4Fe4S-binding SPASM domain
MKDIPYKKFSLSTHKKNWQIDRPNVCQFELTFSCDFHCLYCYSDCYNKPSHIKRELSTQQIKFILDKVYDAGCLWLCFTGGDPLRRKDFLEIYDYAKQKGFIITIFTNGYSLTKEIADFLKAKPPFVVEITLNAVNKKTFEEISGLADSYEKTMKAINMLIKRKIPLKIKTMVIKNNLEQLPKIKKFVEALGLRFDPSPFIHARLNGDLTPCSLRISPQQALGLDGQFDTDAIQENEFNCSNRLNRDNRPKADSDYLFRCAAGGKDGIHIDPYGKMFFCLSLRQPSIDVLRQDIQEGLFRLFPKMRKERLVKGSTCRSCGIRYLCYSCPGNAFLEKGDMESHLEWYCELAHLAAGYKLYATGSRLQDTSYKPQPSR